MENGTAAVALSSAEEASRKRARGNKTIGTHDGTFHCDEALGCFILKLTKEFQDAEIIRTRDEKALAELDAVLDVGAVYDPSRNRFDHHQREFCEVLGSGDFKTKLSSAGLVYKHFGREVIADIMGRQQQDADVEKVYLTCYKNFMEAVDAVDNGINQYEVDAPPRYVNNTTLSARVSHLNPDWTEECTPEKQMVQFRKAMELTGEEFLQSVRSTAFSWLPARSIVLATLQSARTVHPSGEILKLEQYCPWKSHLDELEKELKVDPLPKYILYGDEKGSWRVQAIAVAPGKFESRRPLPAPWRGVRDDELSKLSGIPDCIFVHASGFIGGNKTYEGAFQMASKALEM